MDNTFVGLKIWTDFDDDFIYHKIMDDLSLFIFSKVFIKFWLKIFSLI